MRYQKTVLSIVGSVSVAGILYGLSLFGEHWANANDNHRQLPKIEELARSNYQVVKELSERAKVDDSRRERDRELCLQKKLTDLVICGLAGVEVD